MANTVSRLALSLAVSAVILQSSLANSELSAEGAAFGPQSVTEDLSQGRTFRFSINPALPSFVFKLRPHLQPTDEFGNSQSTIQDIEVYRDRSATPFQHLTGCDLEGMEPPGAAAKFFLAEDINFDGYKDIYLETGHGATGNESGCVWLYDPATQRFDFSQAFSDLSRFWLDPSTKTIFTFERGGMLGFVHSAQKYAVEKNRPVLIRSETQDWDFTKKQFHCVVKELRGNQMAVVRDAWGKDGEDDPPCDPSVLFQQLPSEP
jgi:hypothetical protein